MISNQQLFAFIKAQPISVGCGVLVVLLGAGIYFRSDLIPEAEKLLDERSALGERIDANLKNGVQLSEQLTAVSAAREQIEARLVHPDDLAKNLQYFYKIQAETNTELIDLHQNVAAPKVGGKAAVKAIYLPVGYSVAVRGDYPKLIDFLHRLEANQRYCRINSASIALSGTTDKDRANALTLNLGLELLGQP